MNTRSIRRLLALAFLSLAATACGSSSPTAPECGETELSCGYIPDSGGFDSGYIPDSGGMDSGYIPDSGG